MDAVDAAIDAIQLIAAFNEGSFFDDEVLLLQASVIAQRILFSPDNPILLDYLVKI